MIFENLLATISWSNVGLAGVVLLGVGLLLVAMLNVAYAKLAVKPNPVVEAILGVLPGANCGGCGLAGCSAYAEAVAKDHGLMGRCGPGGDTVVRRIGAILGIEAAASAPRRAVLHCAAKISDKINTTRYQGALSCAEAQMVPGAMGCPYGCLGYRDCVVACAFDAIEIIEGLAVINYHKCVGCGACVKACPRALITLLDFSEDPMLVIACSSIDKAKEVRSYCNVGCVGCGICAKLAPNTFQLQQNLAVIDYQKYGRWADSEKARVKCPRQMMLLVGKNAQIKKIESEKAIVEN